MNKFGVIASVLCVLLAGQVVLSAPAPQAGDAAPRSLGQDVEVVRYFSENNGPDGYKFT